MFLLRSGRLRIKNPRNIGPGHVKLGLAKVGVEGSNPFARSKISMSSKPFRDVTTSHAGESRDAWHSRRFPLEAQISRHSPGQDAKSRSIETPTQDVRL